MDDQERAERMLRKRFARERRTYGLLPKTESVEYLGISGKYHDFGVKFTNGETDIFQVRLYAKSAKIWRA